MARSMETAVRRVTNHTIPMKSQRIASLRVFKAKESSMPQAAVAAEYQARSRAAPDRSAV